MARAFFEISDHEGVRPALIVGYEFTENDDDFLDCELEIRCQDGYRDYTIYGAEARAKFAELQGMESE